MAAKTRPYKRSAVQHTPRTWLVRIGAIPITGYGSIELNIKGECISHVAVYKGGFSLVQFRDSDVCMLFL